MLTRVRSVVNTYSIVSDSDDEIEVSFTEAVNDSLRDLENQGCMVVEVNFSTIMNGDSLVKSADIMYEAEEEVDMEDEEEEEIPELGEGRRKVTRQVFTFIKEKAAEGWTQKEIADLFNGDLSQWTVNKVLNTRVFSHYYAD